MASSLCSTVIRIPDPLDFWSKWPVHHKTFSKAQAERASCPFVAESRKCIKLVGIFSSAPEGKACFVLNPENPKAFWCYNDFHDKYNVMACHSKVDLLEIFSRTCLMIVHCNILHGISAIYSRNSPIAFTGGYCQA